MPLTAITSMLLIIFHQFAGYFWLETVPCTMLVYELTLKNENFEEKKNSCERSLLK